MHMCVLGTFGDQDNLQGVSYFALRVSSFTLRAPRMELGSLGLAAGVLLSPLALYLIGPGRNF